jgi:hypothetical protein
MRNKRMTKTIAVIIVTIILIYTIPTVAKYVTDRIKSYYLKSKDFYFSSNLLDTSNTTYQIGTWSGAGSFDVEFELYSKENDYLFSESDITYTVTSNCSTDAVCTLSKSSGTLFASDTTHMDTITVHVNPQRVFQANESVTINVTAKSTAPYTKELKATFQYIVGMEGVSYTIEDEANRTYLLLKVTNDIDYCTVINAFGSYTPGNLISDSVYRTLSESNKHNCVSQYISLSFNPNQLLLDNTSNVMDNATYNTTTIGGINYINSLNFAIAPNSTIAIKFYKIDMTANYTYNGTGTSVITVSASSPT